MTEPKQKWAAKQFGIIKGKSTAFLISAAIHVVLLLAAGTIVAFKIIQAKTHDGFVPPPPVERTKMKLKKLQVKIKQNTRPKQQTERISTAVTKGLPEIQLPAMTGGFGGGLAEGIGGFQMITDLENMSLLGAEVSIGNDLEGAFFDLKRLKSGADNPEFPASNDNGERIRALVKKFLANDWSDSVFSEFYRAPKRLFATQLMVPPCASMVGPSKFGVGDDIVASSWIATYHGKIAHKDGGKFRFWGEGDDILIVRVNGEYSFDGSWGDDGFNAPGLVLTDKDEHRKHYIGTKPARVGNWFTLKPGEPVQMDVLVSEIPGGTFSMMVLVEEYGVTYPKNKKGSPILPMFKTMETPPHLVDELMYSTVPDSFAITGGPLFSVY